LQGRYPLFELENLGYRPHAESVNYLQTSDALLLLIPDLPNNKGILTGKIFEYIGSGRPIWGFGPTDGDAQEILTQSAAGALFETASEASAVLQSWMEHCPQGASPEARSAFTRLGLAKKLVG
jgi:hypothetical protein